MATRPPSLTAEQDALKLEALRVLIKASIDDLDRGNYVEVDDADLEAFLEGLTSPESHAG
jgi:hypothetical protein